MQHVEFFLLTKTSIPIKNTICITVYGLYPNYFFKTRNQFPLYELSRSKATFPDQALLSKAVLTYMGYGRILFYCSCFFLFKILLIITFQRNSMENSIPFNIFFCPGLKNPNHHLKENQTISTELWYLLFLMHTNKSHCLMVQSHFY